MSSNEEIIGAHNENGNNLLRRKQAIERKEKKKACFTYLLVSFLYGKESEGRGGKKRGKINKLHYDRTK